MTETKRKEERGDREIFVIITIPFKEIQKHFHSKMRYNFVSL